MGLFTGIEDLRYGFASMVVLMGLTFGGLRYGRLPRWLIGLLLTKCLKHRTARGCIVAGNRLKETCFASTVARKPAAP